jgi:hypothetical protein
MACFHPVASIALGYILGYIHFHIGPPEILLQVLVHLGTAGMNRKFGHMSFIKDDLRNFRIDKNHKAFAEPDHILVSFRKQVYLGSPSASFCLMICKFSSLR